ncbi:helix-turn-helix domain-containing protein [Anaerotignum sp.]|uniref:helix-turn-helix domain-containing protein n=1 Tax=Anaerotignum sp. TaxID=2039241 RepID=UPI002714E10A|nr:helix-turn-helix domain-containing protein [Anaerotignum sp.]
MVGVNDLQNLLHIGRNKAYELLRNNEIRSIKIGRDYKIPKRCIIDYIYNGLGIQNNNALCYNIIDFKSGLSIKGE